MQKANDIEPNSYFSAKGSPPTPPLPDNDTKEIEG